MTLKIKNYHWLLFDTSVINFKVILGQNCPKVYFSLPISWKKLIDSNKLNNRLIYKCSNLLNFTKNKIYLHRIIRKNVFLKMTLLNYGVGYSGKLVRLKNEQCWDKLLYKRYINNDKFKINTADKQSPFHRSRYSAVTR